MFSSRKEAFEATRSLWPNEIRILESHDAASVSNASPQLWNIYQEVESKLPVEDDWAKLTAWSFHQALDKLGRRRARERRESLRPMDVSLASFDTMMKMNLSDEDWRDERLVYDSLPMFPIKSSSKTI